MPETPTDLTLTLLREMRAEMREQRTLLLGVADGLRRMDRRVAELKDDLELMLRTEVMGRLTNHETMIEQRLDALTDRVTALEVAR